MTLTTTNGAGAATSQTSVTVTTSIRYTLAQSLTDEAQRTTLAFAGLGLMTGNLAAQSFFPPGKVADYTGFQYLRDNDPDAMGHNTSFLTRVANNVIYVLDDAQFAQLETLAVSQMDLIDRYGYQRYPLMQTFRRLVDADVYFCPERHGTYYGSFYMKDAPAVGHEYETQLDDHYGQPRDWNA